MAAKHILSLEIPECVSNCDIFSIKDTSEYVEKNYLKVDCGHLYITPPGFKTPQKLIKTAKGFDLHLSACALGVQTTECDSCRNALPDGIYTVRYSVSPHEKVYVEYNHLRTTVIINDYYNKLCDLNLKACEPNTAMKELTSEMKFIRTMIDAAKAKVEYGHSPNEGMELYNYALERLKKITCDVSCC